jgi:hypothetical protein
MLDGRKTQTRRVINPHKYNIAGWDMPRTKEDMEAGYPVAENADGDFVSVVDWCPYGRVGDRLWVKETFKIADSVTVNGIAPALYKADCSGFALANIDRWKSPLFMPRRLSRITLEITDIRVERVQDITEDDALAEGIISNEEYEARASEDNLFPCPRCKGYQVHEAFGYDYGITEVDCNYCDTQKKRYRIVWDSLNAKRGYPWESNPWVWVISFKKVHNQKEE